MKPLQSLLFSLLVFGGISFSCYGQGEPAFDLKMPKEDFTLVHSANLSIYEKEGYLRCEVIDTGSIYICFKKNDRIDTVKKIPSATNKYKAQEGNLFNYVKHQLNKPLPLFRTIDFTRSVLPFQLHWVENSSYKGKTLLVNLWDVYCAACAIELPILNKIAQESDTAEYAVIGFYNGLFSFNLQSQRYIFDRQTPPSKKNAVNFLQIPLGKDKIEEYNIILRPTSYLVDKNGIIRDIILGSPPKEVWSAVLKKLAFIHAHY